MKQKKNNVSRETIKATQMSGFLFMCNTAFK